MPAHASWWLGRWVGDFTWEESFLLSHKAAMTLHMEGAQGQVCARLLAPSPTLRLVCPGCSTSLPGRFPGPASRCVASSIASPCIMASEKPTRVLQTGWTDPLSTKLTMSILHWVKGLECKVWGPLEKIMWPKEEVKTALLHSFQSFPRGMISSSVYNQL